MNPPRPPVPLSKFQEEAPEAWQFYKSILLGLLKANKSMIQKLGGLEGALESLEELIDAGVVTVAEQEDKFFLAIWDENEGRYVCNQEE